MRHGVSFREKMATPLKEKILNGILLSLASFAVITFILFMFIH